MGLGRPESLNVHCPDLVGIRLSRMRPVLATVSRTLILIMLIYQTRIGLMRVNFFTDIFKELVGSNCYSGGDVINCSIF